ncbi:Fe-S cluster assembly protein SufD [Brevirhabdus pacifica]|uniref:Fe-S cluster assembly protein SufD n=1 Tax=Brevirhabdus pacifica TaxID=1267768 RepID=A0A1U7DFF9_9RHOB|nr:SufD family Fe-S cluster assembly protein [Brevirhabdus pacifica]APX88734.1 Fe-S cluster assembly protein SufD [Brevirhabdus pacifica]OWU79991.1 Fe-S cluster assembly protein SufD [Loktanella sp. 22II-4b]PJJ86746.1 Fe-S cluster assembly protein SufD [Brevirhabdus pacifica]
MSATLQKNTPAAPDLASALARPPRGGWVEAARAAAEARLEQTGLPGRRDEYWRFTRPDTLTAPEAGTAALLKDDEAPFFGGTDCLNLVFVDGAFDADASDKLEGTGLTIERLADVAATSDHWAQELYGVLEARGQKPVVRPLAAINTARATDGLLIRATGKVEKPIAIRYLRRDADADAMLHSVVRVEEGASLTLLENGPAAARFNSVLEVDLGDEAAFHHIRTQGRDHERREATHIFARLGRESLFKSFTLSANGALTRNECIIEMTGDDGVAHVAGAALGDGASGAFHHDDTIFVTHDALRCESRQVFKKVLRNGAVGVFQGKILVKAGAQKTDGYQISQSLLLDEDSQFLAKPELEIYADDVVCSHGSTTGAIDETALFYLRSRGVEKAEAQDLLVLSFLAEAIEEIDDADLAANINDRLAAWLRRRRS